MSYYNAEETKNRIVNIREILKKNDLDAALIYYDELNIANGWYLTGWCPQFEKGAVLLPLSSEPILLGGPESAPFAHMNSAITNTRNFSAFMVPGEEYPNATIIGFNELNQELLEDNIHLKKVGIVGTEYFPLNVYNQFANGFKGVELVDITEEYEDLRARKSVWERENIKKAFGLAYEGYLAMKAKVNDGVYEYEVAAEGEYVCRKAGANSFAYSAIVGSGERLNAVVPTAINKQMADGELIMLGLAPRINGYAGVFGDTIPVSGEYTAKQKEILNIIREAFRATRTMLRPGVSGKEIDIPARKIYEKHNLEQYIVCPFAHTIGLMEAEGPFYGPKSEYVLEPGMTVSIDVSLFGHPEIHGARIETGYIITENGYESLIPELDALFDEDIK